MEVDVKGPASVTAARKTDESAESCDPEIDVPKRVIIPEEEKPTKEQMMVLWTEQEAYIDYLEKRMLAKSTPDVSSREHLLVVRLATKEQELQELSAQIAELKAAQLPSTNAMKNALLDPAVNIIVQKLKKELDATKAKLAQTNEEMSAWKFTPDSVTGKRLMARCRQLLQENEEIGKMVSSGKLARLEGELAMQKRLVEEMKKAQLETDDFVQELDEDMEGMQSTIYFLQQQLKESKDSIAQLEVKLKEAHDQSPEPECSPQHSTTDRDSSTPTKSGRKRAVKDSPGSSTRRGRSAKQTKQDKEEDEGDEGGTGSEARPRRRRAAPQRFDGSSTKSKDNENDDIDEETKT